MASNPPQARITAFGAQIDDAVLMADAHALDPVVALQQGQRRGLVIDRDVLALAGRVQRLHQLLAAAPDVAGEPAPELEFSIHLERLAAEAQLKPHAFGAHPLAGLEALGDEDFGEVGVGAVFGQPPDVVVILLGGVGADIDVCELVVAHVGDEGREVVEAVIDDAERAAGKRRIAAGRVLRRDLQHQHRGAVLPRRQGRAGRRIAGPDDDHIPLGDLHVCFPLPDESRDLS